MRQGRKLKTSRWISACYSLCLSALFLLLLCASASQAQPRHESERAVRMFYGLLSPLDRALPGRERYKRYAVDVKAGEVWTFDARSPHFSPFLVLRSARGQRDAGGVLGMHRAELRYEARRDERLELLVSTSVRGEIGAFGLRMHKSVNQDFQEPRSPFIRSELVANSRVDGQIDAHTDRTPTGIGVDRYEYLGTAGERIVIRASSPNFVPLVMIHGEDVALHSSDPVGKERQAELQVVLPTTGRYVIRVLSGPNVKEAPYTLRVRSASTHNAGLTSRPRLVLGAHVEGKLMPPTPPLSKEARAQRYRLRLEKGQGVSIQLRSSDFEGTVTVTTPAQTLLDTVETREHTPQDRQTFRSSRRGIVAFQAPITGDYEVSVEPDRMDAWGDYLLSVLRAEDATEETLKDTRNDDSARTPLRAGRPARGQLKFDAPQMKDLSYYHAYRLPVNQGERWTIEMSSLSFDTHLELRGPRGFALSNDDRSPKNTDSLLTFDAPFTGDLTIYATSHLPRAVGPFSLHAYKGDPDIDEDQDEGRLIAVLVGLSEYAPASWEPLPYCAADAVRVGGSLTSTGMLAPESTILIDAHATRDALVQAMEYAAEVVQPNDLFLFFFSGHGGQLTSDDPMERDGLDETLVLYDGQIRDDELGDLLLNIDSRLSLVVLDACYSGGFRDTLRRRKNQIGIFSSEEDVSSLVAEQFEAGGYLSNLLLYGLAGSADRSPADGILTVDELLQYLRMAWNEFGQVLAVDSSDRFAHQELVIERGYTSPQEVILKRPATQR